MFIWGGRQFPVGNVIAGCCVASVPYPGAVADLVSAHFLFFGYARESVKFMSFRLQQFGFIFLFYLRNFEKKTRLFFFFPFLMLNGLSDSSGE